MGSRIKSLLYSRKASFNNTKGIAYDTSVAAEPPLRGSYPVAGNGPILLEDIQRGKLGSSSSIISSGQAKASNAHLSRQDELEQPTTASTGRGIAGSIGFASIHDDVRSRSRASIKAPSNFSTLNGDISNFSASEATPPLARTTNVVVKREVKVYQPTRGAHSAIPSISSVAQSRSTSVASRTGSVDILDAQSTIRTSRDVSRRRTQASGAHSYRENVADRNIALYGEREKTTIPTAPQDSRQLDLPMPESSSWKPLHDAQEGATVVDETELRAASALGHLDRDSSGSDDIVRVSNSKQHLKASSAPAMYILRTPPPATAHDHMHDVDDDPPITQKRPVERRNRFSLRAPITTSPDFASLQQPSSSNPRGRSRTLREPPPVPPASEFPSRTLKEPPPVPPPSEFPRAFPEARPVDTSAGSTQPKRLRRRTMSAIQNTSSNPDASSRHGTLSHRPLTASGSKDQGKGMIVEGATEAPSLDGIVDLSDTVDTDVTTKTLPAVTHETVIRAHREIRQERITREIHNHDIYHRVLPVIDTEILPTKHYQKQKDGSLVEVPASLVERHGPMWKMEPVTPTRSSHSHNQSGSTIQHPSSEDSDPAAEPQAVSLNRSIHRKPVAQADESHPSSATISPNTTSYGGDGADGPVIPTARGDPTPGATRSRSNSVKAFVKRSMEPTLKDKKTYMTEEGYPRTEYVWHHPAVFEDMHLRTSTYPAFVGTDMSDIPTPMSPESRRSTQYSTTDSDSEYGGRRSAKGEENLLFNDSGYGTGSLPGLTAPSPMARFPGGRSNEGTRGNAFSNGKTSSEGGRTSTSSGGAAGPEVPRMSSRGVIDDEPSHGRKKSEGVATKLLKRLRERRKSNAASNDQIFDEE